MAAKDVLTWIIAIAILISVGVSMFMIFSSV